MSRRTNIVLEESHIYREIHEQPAALARFIEKEWDNVHALAEAIQAQKITHVVIAARGTSDNAGRYAKYVLGAHNGLMVALATPSLFSIYGQPPQFHNALVLGVSQSGKSPDIVSVVAEARRQGALTAVITNVADSDLAQEGDFVIDIQAGPELAVAATKSYTNQLAAIALLSAALNPGDGWLKELQAIPDAVAKVLEVNDLVAQAAPRYRYMDRSVIIGRGFNYATAFELALKMKELTYTLVEPYSSADFQHGPMAMIEDGFPVLVVASGGVLQDEMLAFVNLLNERGAEVIAISDVDEILNAARTPLPLPQSAPEWLSPITAIVPGQLFAMHLAYTRDFDIDAPRGLRKVTETH